MTPAGARPNLARLGWAYGTRFFLAGGQVLLAALLARRVAHVEFGMAAVWMATAELASYVASLGLGAAVIQRREYDARLAFGVLFAGLAGGLALGGLAALAGHHLPRLLDPESAASVPGPGLLLGLFVAASVSHVVRCLLQRAGRIKFMGLVEVVSFVAVLLPLSLLLTARHPVAGSLLAAYALHVAVQAVLGVGRLWRAAELAPALRPAGLAGLLPKGAGFALSDILAWGSLNVDRYVLGRLLGLGAVGLYTRAQALTSMYLNLMMNALDTVLFPALSRVQGAPAEMGRLTLMSTRLALTLTAPAAALCLAAPGEIVRVVLGPGWLEAAAVLPWLGLLMPVRAGGRVNDFVIRALGRVKLRVVLAGSFLLVATAALVLGARQGLVAAAAAYLVAFALYWALLAALTLRWLGLPAGQYLRAVAGPLAWAAVLAALGWGAGQALRAAGAPAWLHLLAVGGLTAACHAAILLWRPAWLLGGAGAEAVAHLRGHLLGRRGGKAA